MREINTTCYFMKDMDYESKRKLCDVPTSRLCSELVYCKTMPVQPASISCWFNMLFLLVVVYF